MDTFPAEHDVLEILKTGGTQPRTIIPSVHNMRGSVLWIVTFITSVTTVLVPAIMLSLLWSKNPAGFGVSY